MKDLTIALENRPGALAEMGEALGHAGVSIEGGGAFVVNGAGVAHLPKLTRMRAPYMRGRPNSAVSKPVAIPTPAMKV